MPADIVTTSRVGLADLAAIDFTGSGDGADNSVWLNGGQGRGYGAGDPVRIGSYGTGCGGCAASDLGDGISEVLWQEGALCLLTL